MTYKLIQSLCDLKEGKVYFKNGRAYYIEKATSDKITGTIDRYSNFSLKLTPEVHSEYLDNVSQENRKELFYKLD